MHVSGDTTRSAIARGPALGGGWRDLVVAPGEPNPEAIPLGEVIACIWHLSDLHVCDAESPARMEYLDRYADPDSPYRSLLGDIGTYRPQEALTVQVAASMVSAVNAHTTGPVTGRPVDSVVITGDVTDNAQLNELSWYQGVLDGGVISPRSGDPTTSSWVGATDPSTWDERFWHPDGPPPGVEPDLPSRRYGYPSIPGLTEAVRRDVRSPGLALPWLTVPGNHDSLLQGTVVPDNDLRSLALGDERITGLGPGHDPVSAAQAMGEVGPARYSHDGTSPRARIEADTARDFVRPGDFARVTRGGSSEATYFASDVGGLRLIALDTVNPHGGWQGSIDADQLDWLIAELDAVGDRVVVIASHHPSHTIVNDYAPEHAGRRILGPTIVRTLLAHPSVVAWIAGHVHCHSATRHGDETTGFWEITTSSLIDWPQQGRILEFIRDTAAGEIAIVSTVIDHLAPAQWSASALDDPVNLAAISRTLAANDYRLRHDSPRGDRLNSSPAMRNNVWRTRDPLA